MLGIGRAFSYLPQQVGHQNLATLGLIHYPGGHNHGRAEVVFFLFDHFAQVKADANISRGDYRSDVLADFAGGAFSRDKYSWPTALIEVRDIFTISGSDSGEDTVIGSQLMVSDDAGGIDSWTLP